ncbi:MAG: twin-arginine translocase subunit TatB [Herpetosiphonaceae bacterium]|nr:twin-arginine translocase subunit TatB [Herpetosiphonaceae bacterium]
MTIFGIGPFELLIIVVIALVVVGPERLPEMMFQIGQGINKVKRLILDLRDQARTELGDDYESFEQMTRQIRELDPRRQIQDLGRSLLDDSAPFPKIDIPKSAVVLPLPRSEAADLARMMLDDDLLDVPLQESLSPKSAAATVSDLLNEPPLPAESSSAVPATITQEHEKYG